MEENEGVIKSDALAANLSQTKVDEVIIPENHLWFLSLSSDFWGIHNRTHEFLKELHHPMSNRKDVIDSLLKISISDFWIFKDLPERRRAMDIILDIYEQLINEELSYTLETHLIAIYLDFLADNYESLAEYEQLLQKYIDILTRNINKREFVYLSNMGAFRKKFNVLIQNEKTHERAFNFMQNLVQRNLTFWRDTTRFEKWYNNNHELMSADYSKIVQQIGSQVFNNYLNRASESKTWEQLEPLTFAFSDIVDEFRKKIDAFKKPTEQLYYIFYLLHLPGTINHGDTLLLDLNKAIKRISELDEDQCLQAIDELFALFNDFKNSHTNLILDSILVLGKEIIKDRSLQLITHLEDKIIEFGFFSPGVAYLTNDWELKVDPNHIKNIRVWLELIEQNPEIMHRLLAALIINLRIGGIFIFDTDFFQKDITKLLNSNIQPIYKHIKQLARIFPVYFSEIGAEGLLRDVSTKIDEISHRNDKLIHFLRKQVHTEGNNSHINITYKIFEFWNSLDIEQIKDIIPQNVLETIDINSQWVQGVHNVIKQACQVTDCKHYNLLELEKDNLKQILGKIKHQNENDKNRVELLVELYQLLKEKYHFDTNNIGAILRKYHFINNEDIDNLLSCMNKSNEVESLKAIFKIMEGLNQIIFNPKISDGWENIFYKRHIAVGIPSMYGYYRESKFEALGVTFRLERIATGLISSIIGKLNTEYFTAKTFDDLHQLLQLLHQGLALDGISDPSFDSNLKMFRFSLQSDSFTIRQYINIFQFMEQSIKDIINKYFITPYATLLQQIVANYIPKNLNKPAQKKAIAKKTEIFYRELLSSSFIIQSLDNLLGRVLNNLRQQIELLTDDEIQKIMTYNPELVMSPLYRATPDMDNQVFIGSKAYFLKDLYLKHFPIPAGFVITTEIFRRVAPIVKVPALNNEIDRLLWENIHQLEKISGRRFGDPQNPLLLSVRSGAAISMPGVMNTFLNVGMNDEITEKLSQQPNLGWSAWDCYRRLLQTRGMANGLNRDIFDQIILGYKQKQGVRSKIDFSPSMMREIALSYKQVLAENGVDFEQDPFEQMKQAIISVFDSWDTERAKVYRERMQIAHEWGTAAIVQQMIFGNLHRESGSGVVFTCDTQSTSQKISLTGDFSYLSQGEDIVAGLINTLPISEIQRQKYYKKSPYSLQTAYPKIYEKLLSIAHELIDKYGYGHQEIEFTFENANPEGLYILQIRDMMVKKDSSIEVFATAPKSMTRVSCGVGIGNRVLNGVLVFDLADVAKLKAEKPGVNAVLVRPDTVPDDIEMIFECEGLLTAKGGATSHAAVTAGTLGKTCIVNCDDMQVFDNEKRCLINGYEFKLFDQIAIDGVNGVVYKGNYPIKKIEI